MTEPTSPLQIPAYRLFWFSRLASVIATSGMVVVIGYQLYDLARSDYGMGISQAALLLGLLGFAQFLPIAVLTPIAGVVADRYDRRLVASASVAVDLGVATLLALATAGGKITLPLLFALAACHGIARVFLGPALSAIAPNIVPAALMPRAIAYSSMAWQIGSVVGPALGGLAFGMASALPYWAGAGLLAISCLGIFLIGPLPPPPGSRDIHPFRQVAEGFRFVRNERFLLGCVTLDLFAVLLGGATALLPVFARDILHVGPDGLGLMRAAPAAGSVLVALWLTQRPLVHNVGVKMLWAVAAYGAATIAFGLSRSFPLSLALLALLGAADMISVFIRNTLIQLNTPDEVRGRVSAISGLAISASNELGEMQSGLAAALLGVTGAVVFGGAGAIFVTIAWAFLYPEIRNARTFAPQYRQSHRQKEQAP